MIEQQYYTRERKGVFSSSPGFDTVARSSGLSDYFIKNILHQFCVYETPAELIGKSDIKKELYPDCITCYTADTELRELIIGKSCFAGLDYTGMRDTYFVHNLVLTEVEKTRCLSDLEKIFSINIFEESYNPEVGQDLEQVSSLIISDEDGLLSFKEALIKADIDEKIFKSIIIASIKSVVNKKKVYISLNAEAKDFSLIAKSLMKYIIAVLPQAVRSSFGFMTYAPQPKNRKNINLMFIEKGGIRHNDSEVIREYVFDLTKKKYINIDVDEKSKYVDLAVLYLANGGYGNLKEMNNLIERPYALLCKVEKPTVELFDALLDLVNWKVDCDNRNHEDFSSLLILTHKLVCKSPTQVFSPFKDKFDNMLKCLIDLQLDDKYIAALIEIYEDEDCHPATKKEIMDIIKINLIEKKYSDPIKIEILNNLSDSIELIKDIVEMLKGETNDTIHVFAANKIKNAKSIGELDKVLEFLSKRNSFNCRDIVTQDAMEQLLVKIIKNSSNKFEARKSLKNLLVKHEAKFGIDIIDREAFRNLDISNITKSDLKHLSNSDIVSIPDKLIILKLLVLIENLNTNTGTDKKYLPEYHHIILDQMREISKKNLLPMAQRAIKDIYLQDENSEYRKLKYAFYMNNRMDKSSLTFNIGDMTNFMKSSLKNKNNYIKYLNYLYKNWSILTDNKDFEKTRYFENFITEMVDNKESFNELVNDLDINIQDIFKNIKNERKFIRKFGRWIKEYIFYIAIIILIVIILGGLVFILKWKDII